MGWASYLEDNLQARIERLSTEFENLSREFQADATAARIREQQAKLSRVAVAAAAVFQQLLDVVTDPNHSASVEAFAARSLAERFKTLLAASEETVATLGKELATLRRQLAVERSAHAIETRKLNETLAKLKDELDLRDNFSQHVDRSLQASRVAKPAAKKPPKRR